MMILKMLLWILGGLGVIALICRFTLWLERYFSEETYDERQKIARGNAYRVCFYVSILWLLAGLVLWSWLEEKWLFLYFGLGLEVQFMTFHIYCFMTHAAMPLSGKPKAVIRGYGLLAVYSGIKTAADIWQNAQQPRTPPVPIWFSLSVTVVWATLAVLHLIQYLRDRRE